MCYHSGPEWTWEQWQWRGPPHSPKSQHHWNLAIRLFSVISRTLIEWSYTSAEEQSVYSTVPADLASHIWNYSTLCKQMRIKTHKGLYTIKHDQSTTSLSLLSLSLSLSLTHTHTHTLSLSLSLFSLSLSLSLRSFITRFIRKDICRLMTGRY